MHRRLLRAALCVLGVYFFFFGKSALGATSGGRGQEAWEAEWKQTVAAAKKEGKVVIYGGPGPDRRKVYRDHFEAAFPGIRVDYEGLHGNQSSFRIITERRAGKYIPDIHLNAAGSLFRSLKPQGAFQPVRSVLALPEVLDETKWFEGKLWFLDNDGKYILTYSLAASTMIAINTQLANPKDITSYQQLLNPKWRGKILSHDIRATGPGSGNARYWYADPKLGPDFLKRLYGEMEITVSRDTQQMVDWLAKGRFAILLFPTLNEIDRAREVGLPVDVVPAQQMKEGYPVTAGFNSILLMNPAPHPNAAKVYLNWLLSREGQTAFEKVIETPSLRVDTPTKESLRPFLIPQKGTHYMVVSDEKYEDLHEKGIRPLLEGVLGRR